MDHTYHPSLQLLEPVAQDTLSNSHSTRFQPLLHRLLTSFCEEQVIPAMTVEEVRRVVYLSRFHDIGKQSLPRSIRWRSAGSCSSTPRWVSGCFAPSPPCGSTPTTMFSVTSACITTNGGTAAVTRTD